MRQFKAAVFGAGFCGGAVHIEGIRRLGNVEVAAVAASTDAKAALLGEQLNIPKAAGDYRRILEDASIDAVHICTPQRAASSHGARCAAGRQARALREAARRIVR